MTAEELGRVEQSLDIRLPESYRRRMLRFPIAAAAGNTDLAVWDDADRLIEFNLELRRGAPGGVKPWPPHFFAIGHAGDGCPQALDLRSGDAVWWVDHCHLDNPGSGQLSESFSTWADEYFATVRQEMAEEVDPDGSPQQRAKAEGRAALRGAIGCFVATVIIAAAMVAVMWFASR